MWDYDEDYYYDGKSAKPGNLHDGEQQCELLVDGRSYLHQTLAFRQNPVLSGDLILSNSI